VAEHCIDLCHVIQLSDTSVLAKKSRHMVRKIMEVIETELHSKNMNKVGGFSLSRSWNPLTHTLKYVRRFTLTRHTAHFFLT
jgi:hypothetical protein